MGGCVALVFWCFLSGGTCLCVCVCQALFQRAKQGGNLVSIAGCPTKRAMPRLIWRLIISTYLLLRPRKPYKCVPPEEWGCCRYFYRLVMACSKNYLLPTHRFSVFIHDWTRTVAQHMLASIKQVCLRRLASVSHSMARLPVWSLRVRATSMIQQLCTSYPFFPLPFFLLCFLASRCGHVLNSFSRDSGWPETYSVVVQLFGNPSPHDRSR